MVDDSEVVDVSDVSKSENGFDFYGKIDRLVDGLDLPQNCFEASCRVCDSIRELENFKHGFLSFGGYDAVVVTSVFIAARQERCPVPAQVLTDFVFSSPVFEMSDDFDSNKLVKLGRDYGRKVLDDIVFVSAGDYVGFYGERFDFPVLQEDLERDLDVSQVAVRSRYKQIVEGLTGLDTSYKELKDVDVTPVTFGYHGGDVKGFAEFLLGRVEEEDLSVLKCSPRVLAASVLYIAGKLI